MATNVRFCSISMSMVTSWTLCPEGTDSTQSGPEIGNMTCLTTLGYLDCLKGSQTYLYRKGYFK